MFSEFELPILFFLIALLYSSIGFGGGSSYLALLALYGVEFRSLRLIALMCNIIVVSNGSILYLRKGILKLKDVLPFLSTSIPFAFIGGTIKTPEKLFYITLGFVLCAAAFFLWLKKEPAAINRQDFSGRKWALSLVIGAAIGLLSGFVGIGGGIFLAPVLHFFNWNTPKSIAATSSFFILCNSIAGIGGQLSQIALPELNSIEIFSLLMAVFLGGLIGSKISIRLGNTNYIRRLTAFLLLFVGIRLLYLNLI